MSRDGESRKDMRSVCSLLCAVAAGLWLVPCPKATPQEDKKAEAIALFEKAYEVMNFRSSGSQSLRLVQDLKIWTREQGTVEGTYTLVWIDPDRWREELVLPGFHSLLVGSRQTALRLQSPPLPTLAAMKARSLLLVRQPSRVVEIGHVDRIYEQQLGQFTEKCVLLSMGQWVESTYCFDSNQGYILTSRARTPTGEQAKEWDDFINVGGHWIPRLTREFVSGRLTAQCEIKDAATLSSIDPSAFAPPAGAEQIETCDDPEPPKPIRKPEPAYTSAARAKRVQGTLALVVKIDRQGNVEDVGVLESLDPGLDNSAVQTVRKKWKFQPASCRGTPIPTDVMVEVSFRLF